VTALGMAVAELAANAYRHAFPDGAGGTISVALRPPGVPAGEAVLTVGDDGVGFDPGGVASKRHGVGLVRRLMEQVGGSVGVESGRGTTWTLTFPVAAHETLPGGISTA
jgi:two-component sensor histidine kinase